MSDRSPSESACNRTTEDACRCPARMPRTFGPDQPRPAVPGGRCGLPRGHTGKHTVLIPSNVPWAHRGGQR
jgi:hypothetical protein